jgi:hypothetical protein
MRDAIILSSVAALAIGVAPATAGLGDPGGGTAIKIADSLEDYGGDQGENGWFYGYYNGNVPAAYTPSDFELMNVYDDQSGRWWVDNSPGGTLTLIDANLMHPASTGQGVVHWAVRRWVSDFDGNIEINMDLGRGPQAGTAGDGVRLHVFIDGIKRLVTTLTPNDSDGLSILLFDSVAQGSVIDFAIDPNGNELFDGTRFNASITGIIPSPSSIALLGLGTLVMARRRR